MRWIFVLSMVLPLSGCIVSSTMPVMVSPAGENSNGIIGATYASGSLLDSVSNHRAIWVHYGLRQKKRIRGMETMANNMLWFNMGMGVYTEEDITYSGMAAGLGFFIMDTLPFDWFTVEYGGFLVGGIEISNYSVELFSGEVRDDRIFTNPWIGIGTPVGLRIPLGNRTYVSVGATIFPPTISVYGRLSMDGMTIVVERKHIQLYTVSFYFSR